MASSRSSDPTSRAAQNTRPVRRDFYSPAWRLADVLGRKRTGDRRTPPTAQGSPSARAGGAVPNTPQPLGHHELASGPQQTPRRPPRPRRACAMTPRCSRQRRALLRPPRRVCRQTAAETANSRVPRTETKDTRNTRPRGSQAPAPSAGRTVPIGTVDHTKRRTCCSPVQRAACGPPIDPTPTARGCRSQRERRPPDLVCHTAVTTEQTDRSGQTATPPCSIWPDGPAWKRRT